jgi:hypothetical protein
MSNDPDPIAAQRRKTRRQNKLPPDAACVLCGDTTPEALTLFRRSLLERHHVLGNTHARRLTVPLCLKCHALEGERMRSAGVDLRHDVKRQLPDTLVSVLRALGVFFTGLGEQLLAWAEQLASLIVALDREHPGWRALPEAQA